MALQNFRRDCSCVKVTKTELFLYFGSLLLYPSISTKLGKNTRIIVGANFVAAKFRSFSVKGSFFSKKKHFTSILSTPSGGCSSAQGICFKTIGFMLSNRGHAKDVPFLGELYFRRSTVFELLTQEV